jgi:hypothetical protein
VIAEKVLDDDLAIHALFVAVSWRPRSKRLCVSLSSPVPVPNEVLVRLDHCHRTAAVGKELAHFCSRLPISLAADML